MGLFNGKKKAARLKARAETQAYRQIVKKKTTQAARQAYADEAEKVARERARARARRPSIGQVLADRVSGSVRRKVSGTTRRASPVKRRRRRTTTVRRTSPKATQPKQKLINFSEGIFS